MLSLRGACSEVTGQSIAAATQHGAVKKSLSLENQLIDREFRGAITDCHGVELLAMTTARYLRVDYPAGLFARIVRVASEERHSSSPPVSARSSKTSTPTKPAVSIIVRNRSLSAAPATPSTHSCVES